MVLKSLFFMSWMFYLTPTICSIYWNEGPDKSRVLVKDIDIFQNGSMVSVWKELKKSPSLRFSNNYWIGQKNICKKEIKVCGIVKEKEDPGGFVSYCHDLRNKDPLFFHNLQDGGSVKDTEVFWTSWRNTDSLHQHLRGSGTIKEQKPAETVKYFG